jgi:SnoaL-like domain
MTEYTGALAVAVAYHQAWTAKDLDKAMEYIAEGVVLESPGARLEGIERYRAFLGGFLPNVLGYDMLAALGDERTAVLVYRLRTALVEGSLPTVECFSVADGTIIQNVLVFDRTPYEAARAARAE